MSQEIVHLPQSEQPQEPKIDPLMQVSLRSIVSDAALGRGTTPRTHKEQDSWKYKVQDYSNDPVFANGFGVPITEDLDGRFTEIESGVSQNKDGTESKLTANSLKNTIESTYNIDDKEELALENILPSGKKIKTRIDIVHDHDGKHYPGTPIETRIITREDGVSEIKYAHRPMSERRIKAAKRLATYAFGLKYRKPEPRKLWQAKSKQFKVAPETIAVVERAAFELEASGLKGKELRKALLTRYHPDANVGNNTDDEAYKYVESLAM